MARLQAQYPLLVLSVFSEHLCLALKLARFSSSFWWLGMEGSPASRRRAMRGSRARALLRETHQT